MKLGWVRCALLAVMAVMSFTAVARAQAPLPARTGELIIKFKAGATQAERDAILADLGADQLDPLPRIAASRAHITRATVDEAIRRYRGHAQVEYVEPNYLYRTFAVPNDPRFPEMWPLQNTGQTGGVVGADIRAPQAWDVTTGSSSVLVAIVDTGMDYGHPDLSANAFVNPGEIPANGLDDDGNGFVDDVRGYDFVNNDPDPIDDHGHGTHVGGTIGAIGGNGVGVVGVNWQVKLLPVKFLDAFGSGSTDAAIRAIDYAVLMGAKVINASWGGGGYSEALREAIQRAGEAGAVFVAAAGNSGLNIDVFPTYPASYDVATLVAVAASDHRDQMPSWSNYGATSVDLAAPGDNVLSTLPGGYGMASGTSMATPHVCGVLGLVFSRFPNMGALDVKNLLLARTDPIPAFAGRVLTGGRLNAFLTVSDPDSIPPGAIADLAATDVDGSRITMAWTASGDDGPTGTASRFELRYSTTPIDEANFGSATRATGVPIPGPAGTPHQSVVTGLAFATTYHFALKAFDEFGNPSPLSNAVTLTTLPPPDISVSPTELSASLFTGEQATRILTISNTGPAELNVELRVRPAAAGAPATSTRIARTFAMASGTAVAPVGEQAPRPYPSSASPYAAGFTSGRPLYGPADIRITNLQVTNQRVLLLQSGADVSEIRSLLSAFPDLGTVDVMDGSNHVPSLEELAPYQSVLVIVNVAFGDPEGMGNVLADYVDSGGGLVLTLASFIGGWDVRGRLRAEGYVPFSIGSGPIGGASLGAFDAGHPIMAGVQSAVGFILGAVGLTDGAEPVASWDNGQPLVATKGSVAGVNVFVGATGTWSGDVPLLLHNALLWSSAGSWLAAEPREAVVPSGGQLGVVVTFDATDLDGGDYAQILTVSSDDPDQSEVDVRASLHVTGVPDIAVLGDSVSVQSSQDYSVDGASTEHRLAVAAPPQAGAVLDLEANGDYGDFTETATITVEGDSVGSVGAVGVDCAIARAGFPVSLETLGRWLADGEIQASVQNSVNVNAFCVLNRHTVRVRFRGPADQLAFGPVFLGHPRELGLEIRNAGTNPLTVSSIVTGHAAFVPSETGFTLAPRTSRRLVVTFGPDQPIAYAGTLTLVSDDPDEGVVQIPLSGQGLVPPELVASPGEFHETLLSGAVVTRTLTLRNQGGSDLTFTLTPEGPGIVAAGLPAPLEPMPFAPPDLLDRQAGTGPTGDLTGSPDSGASALLDSATDPQASGSPGTPGGLEYGQIRTDQAPASYRPRTAAEFTMSGATVLLIQDVQPWGTAANEAVLQINQISFDVITTAGLATTNLLAYQKVIVAADQPTSAYQQLAARMGQLTAYVQAGGILEFHAAGWGHNSGDASLVTLPGGTRIQRFESYYSYQIVAHPLLAGVPNPILGYFASHAYFTNYPPNTSALTINAAVGYPDYILYSLGRGLVIASAHTLEIGYAHIYDYGQLLRNSVPYGIRPLVSWLSAEPRSGTIPPGGEAQIAVEFRSAGLLGGDYQAQLVLRSNDPDESELRLPASLHVDVAPDIAVVSDVRRLESVKAFAVNAAVTNHDFLLETPPAGDGTVELLADGDFGDFFEAAALDVEGMRLGDVGRTGADCTPAFGQFTLPAADLARVAADGVVHVTVINTFDVDPFCPSNQHTVRLLVAGPGDLLDFGRPFVGSSTTRLVEIRNRGLEDLHVEPLVSSDPQFQIGLAGAVTLAPGAAQAIPLSFLPTAPGMVEASLTITSDDPDEPTVVVTMRGEGLIPPDVAVTPDRVDVHLFTGETADRSIVIENTGGSDLTFDVVVENVSAPPGIARRLAAPRRFSPGPALAAVPGRSGPAAGAPALFAATPGSGSAGTEGAGTTATADEQGPVRSDVPPAQHRLAASTPTTMAGAQVLLVEDVLPWGSTANEQILVQNGIPFTVIPSANIAGTDLRSYSKVIVASDQPSWTYLTIQSRMSQISDYVQGGGVLEFHAAGWGWSAGDASVVVLPGGVRIGLAYSDLNYVLDPAHPLLAGVPSPFTGTSASHAYLYGLPQGALELVEDQLGQTNLVVYGFGSGTVIASGQTLEFGYANQQAAGTILRNMIPFAGRVTPPWLGADPLQGVVPAGGSATVALHLDAAELLGGDYEARVVVRSNDPDEAEVAVPVHLAVTGVPDIAVEGQEVSFESVQSYFTSGARTLHRFSSSVAPAGEGSLELTANGDYGDFFETATAWLEGARVGEAGGTAIDCTPALGVFAVAAEELERAQADGEIVVEVQNTINVDPFCATNDHRVRLRYRGPADVLDFGALFLGRCAELEIRVVNRGTELLHLEPLTVSDAAFYVAFADSAPAADLAPGESRGVRVSFCPLFAGTIEAQLTLRSNDPDEGEVLVLLRGQGLVPPDVAVAPATIHEALLAGQTGTRPLLVANDGGSPLEFRVEIAIVPDSIPPAPAGRAVAPVTALSAAQVQAARDRYRASAPTMAPTFGTPAETHPTPAARAASPAGLTPPVHGNEVVIFFDDMEHGPQDWTHGSTHPNGMDQWSMSTLRSSSGTTSWRVAPHLFEGSEALVTPAIDLAGYLQASLTFQTWYSFDDCYGDPGFEPDGGVVEVSEVGTNQWVQIHPTTGYPYVLDDICFNPLAGRNAYAHDSPAGGTFVTQQFDLSAFAGKRIAIRFHAGWDCGNCELPDGWFIDDVRVFSESPAWVAARPSEGTLGAGEVMQVGVAFDAGQLEPGTYHARLVLRSNDPDEPEVVVPLSLLVADFAAAVDPDPNTVNLGRRGQWLTSFLEHPAGVDLGAVDLSSLRLNGTVPADPAIHTIGDQDDDGVVDLTLKFDFDQVRPTLAQGDDVRVLITGAMQDGRLFLAHEDVRVIRHQLLVPNGGGAVAAGSTLQVTWSVPSDWSGVLADLYWSSNAGASWSPIASGIVGTSYAWQVPAVGSRHALLRVDIRDAVGSLASDASDAVFEIQATPTAAGHGPPAPGDASLRNAPNPFSSRGTEIHFALPAPGPVELEVFNAAGRRVRVLMRGTRGAGPQRVHWDGRDEHGVPGPSGLYFVRLRAAGAEWTRRITLIR